MTTDRLLLSLFYRLPNLSDALTLYVLLNQRADVQELRTSAASLSNHSMRRVVSPTQVRRTFKTLQELELITVRIHANYRTLVKVDRDAVCALLDEPVSQNLPGLGDAEFPFLTYLNEAGSADGDVQVATPANADDQI